MVKLNFIGFFIIGIVRSFGEFRGRVFVVDVRGKVDVVWVLGVNGDFGGFEGEI